jgi:hypothetical protein
MGEYLIPARHIVFSPIRFHAYLKKESKHGTQRHNRKTPLIFFH